MTANEPAIAPRPGQDRLGRGHGRFQISKGFELDGVSRELSLLPDGHKCRRNHGHNYLVTTTVVPDRAHGLPVGLEALSSLVVSVLNEHTHDAGLCTVCGCAWPCERVVLAAHNYDLATR